jgi:hypothetical protein
LVCKAFRLFVPVIVADRRCPTAHPHPGCAVTLRARRCRNPCVAPLLVIGLRRRARAQRSQRASRDGECSEGVPGGVPAAPSGCHPQRS